jgi:hypothetical protein|tara:strand:+ start:164 stop:301 length:138 start_codon:yes stop_codon:yes gene_type:complete
MSDKKIKSKKVKPSKPKHQNGKGDTPRNMSNKFKKNYERINWNKK